MLKLMIAIAVMAAAGVAGAQTAADPASPAKQQLVQHVLQLLHAEGMGLTMLQTPVADALAQANVVLQGRVPVERRDAAMRDISEDAKKFLEQTTPVVKASTQKFIPLTLTPLLMERFTEDELRQLVAMLESPVKEKFEKMVPEMKKVLGEKVASDTRAVIDPKIKDLTERIGVRLRTAAAP
jgi:uncharacterized protein